MVEFIKLQLLGLLLLVFMTILWVVLFWMPVFALVEGTATVARIVNACPII